jgi:hypothetical protein
VRDLKVPSNEAVAIVNDDTSEQQVWSELVKDAGYRPVILSGPFVDAPQMAMVIEANAVFAICDHRLSPKNLAQFTGASAVAEMTVRGKVAALLVTHYLEPDAEITIRRYRRNIPVLLRELPSPESMPGVFRRCREEVQGNVPANRRPWRTLVRITGTSREQGIDLVEALKPAWNPEKIVRFPLELVREDLRGTIQPGLRLFARVNVGAEEGRDLFLDGFEPAPEASPDDGLA